MKHKKQCTEKCWIFLLIILNALFMYYWLALAANYCLHGDDAHFMWRMQNASIFDYVRLMYITRGGNFVSYGLNGVIFTISNRLGAYRFWTLLFYSFGIFMTWSVFRDIPVMKNSGWKELLGVITLYNIYVLTSVDFAVFTWLCAMQYYLFAPALCMLMKYLTKESLDWKQWILLLALALFISGNAVSISTITFMVMFAYGMYMWYKEGWNVRATWAKPQVRRLIGITIFMLLCFAVVFIAPGNWSRMEDEFDIEQPQNIVEFAKAIAKCAGMFIYMMSFYLPYHLIAVAFGAWMGVEHPVSLSVSRSRAIGIAIGIAILYLIASVTPLAYLSNGFEIQRNYIQIGFFYILTFFVLGYLLTNNSKINSAKANKCINVSLYMCTIFLIVIMALNIRQDLPVARAYRKAHDDRKEYLYALQSTGNKETIIVAPYPSTRTPDAKYNVWSWLGRKSPKQAIYYESDTNVEPNDYTFYIRGMYKFDFDFVLKEPKKYVD